MKTRNFILTALLAAFWLPAVLADTPALINYQGRLTAADGTPQSGDKTFTLSIWDAATGGTSLYQEDIGQVTLDDNGIYSFQFGANSENLTTALQNNSEHWIELSVDNDVLSPRQRILAVPFALNAQKAEIAARAEKVGDENGNVNIEGTANVAGASTFSGPVMIADDLDVAGQINAERIYLEGGPFGDIRFDGFHNRLFGEINEFRSIESLFRSDFSIFDGHRVDFRNDITLFRGDEVIFDNHRTIFDTEVLLEGPITDPKHATTKEYVDALSARSAARVAALANVDLQNASPEIDGVTLAAGDRVLLAGQANAAENGL
ncbi:MAG: hypothetical protein GY899_02120, partial [Verrucomicrobiaceae bacterium]|nr:hypothetical protein [Verrucomicrobiaceae bacterium]